MGSGEENLHSELSNGFAMGSEFTKIKKSDAPILSVQDLNLHDEEASINIFPKENGHNLVQENGSYNINLPENGVLHDEGLDFNEDSDKSDAQTNVEQSSQSNLNNSTAHSTDDVQNESQCEEDSSKCVKETVHTTLKSTDETTFEKFSEVCDEIKKKEVVDKNLRLLPEVLGSEDSDAEEDFIPRPLPKEGKPVYKKLHPSEKLEWFDGQHQADTIHRLNVFRKSKQFCDLVLLVGGHEIYCHRVIVGSASRAIFNELSRGEQESGPVARIPCDVTRPGLIADAVEILIDYMYTSRLSIPPNHLTAVYRASLQLGVERITPLCRRYVIANADPDQSVQMRRLAQNNGDRELKHHMDSYIEENFELVAASSEFLSLPRIKMEVLISPNASVVHLLSVSQRDGMLSSTALAWVYDVIQQRGGGYLEELTEQIQRIPLEDLNNAASSFATSNGHNRKLAQDIDRWQTAEGGKPRRMTRSSSMDSLKSSDSNDSLSHICCSPKGEWKVIALTQVSGTELMISLCCLGDVLCTLSIRLPALASPKSDHTNGNELNGYHSNYLSSFSSTSTSCSSSVGSASQLSPLTCARCAAGVAQIDGKIFVAGGFNQVECLDTVESFDPSSNRWTMASRMNEKRARFSVAVLHNKLYAIGGSTGSHDLLLVERYDPEKDTWTRVQSLLCRCSESGVAVLNNLLYCIGGVQQSTGVAGMKACQIYDPMTDEWKAIASLHTGRSSLGVAALGGCLYAVGGSDGWKCLGSAEKYDPVTEHWAFSASLNVHRRGLGLAEHNDALFCVGGFDGQSFLSSVERYCPSEGDIWTVTCSPLTVPRNSVGLVSLNGSLFAVGGYSGRQFLSSIEIVDESSHEWNSQESQAQKSVSSDASVETD